MWGDALGFPMTDPEAEIVALRRAFEAAENRGDPEVQLEHRDPEEFIRMPPGRAPMDYEAANERLKSLYDSADIAVEWESDGVLVDESLAVDSGSFTIEFADGRTRTGDWLMVFRRDEEGTWRVVRDIYNWAEPPQDP